MSLVVSITKKNRLLAKKLTDCVIMLNPIITLVISGLNTKTESKLSSGK